MMIIRPAVTSDAATIAQVHVASWQHAYSHVLPTEFLANLPVEKRQAMWAASIAKDLPHVLVGEVDGRIVGFSAIGPCRDDSAPPDAFEIGAIYLAPTHLSSGLGRELWLASRDFAMSRGAQTISLWVFATNARAIKFYRMAGFEYEENSLQSFELGGVQVEEVRYSRRLGG